MDISGGVTLSDLKPIDIEILYHGCIAVERMAMDKSNMQKRARELRDQLRPLLSQF